VIAVSQRRHHAVVVELAVLRPELLATAAQQMNRHVVERQVFQVQRDPDTVRRGTPKIAIQFHAAMSPAISSAWSNRQTTRTAHSPSPVTPPFITLPGTTAPTPSGVPVKIRSPVCNSNSVDKYAIVSATDQIICEMSARCRSSLLTFSQIAPLLMWPTRVA